MSCLDASRHIGKTRVAGAKLAAGTPITWADVIRCLAGDEARAYALARFRKSGFTPDDFATVRRAREALADALTYTEDHLELQPGGRERERAAIRDVRRRLEWELWP